MEVKEILLNITGRVQQDCDANLALPLRDVFKKFCLVLSVHQSYSPIQSYSRKP